MKNQKVYRIHKPLVLFEYRLSCLHDNVLI